MNEGQKQPSKSLFKHQILITSISIVAVVLIALGGSFAIFSKTSYGDEYNVVQVGQLQLSYVDLNAEGNVLQLASSYPIADSVGSAATPYRFSVENTGTIVADYTIKIIEDTDTVTADGCSSKLLDTAYIRYKFDNGTVGTLKNLQNENGYVVATGTLNPKESNIHEIRLWISETSPNSVLGRHYHGKVIIEMEQKGTSNPYLTPDQEQETVRAKAFQTENLGTSCKTYDDGTDTFLVGQCSKNYVWYSGKLWRVVLKNNETGAVKMVTDNNMTTIAYNESGNTAFENSYMDQWLTQEFLPTLHDTDQFLATNSVWDVTADSSSTPARPNGTTTVDRTVGLLNSFEYYTTYNNSDGLATYSTGYLNNGTYWWLATPYSASGVGCVYGNGDLDYYYPTVARGVRPSVNLKSNIQIASGDGTEAIPYRLQGDSKETINGTTLLNTRYSGEYVRFNSELYRIVGVENNLTKITAVDKPSTLSSNKFHTASGVTNFGEAGIKTDLETYYQGLDTTVKNMIEPNITWYLGTVGDGINYKASICNTVDASTDTKTCEKTVSITTANIGLPRYGEMFTSQITRGTKANFWTLTPYSASAVWRVYYDGSLSNLTPANALGARPFMYLKSNIKIASSNTGDGTYEHPYEIELGS